MFDVGAIRNLQLDRKKSVVETCKQDVQAASEAALKDPQYP